MVNYIKKEALDLLVQQQLSIPISACPFLVNKNKEMVKVILQHMSYISG